MQPQNYTPIDDLIQFYKNSLSSSFSKESEPARSVEYQRVVEHEPVEEVKGYVKHRPEAVKVDKELEDMGVEAKEQIAYQANETIELPLSDERIVEGLHQPITSSWRWLAEFALYLLKQAHYTLKKVHGHIKRVVYS